MSRSRPWARSQTRTEPSALPVARDFPSPDQVAQTTSPACPLRLSDSGRRPRPRSAPRVLAAGRQPRPVRRPGDGPDPARIAIGASSTAAAGRPTSAPSHPDSPSPAASRPATRPRTRPGPDARAGRALRGRCASQTRAVPSRLAVASRVPSGDQATEGTLAGGRSSRLLQVAKPPPVIPLEAAVGIHLGRGEQPRSRPTWPVSHASCIRLMVAAYHSRRISRSAARARPASPLALTAADSANARAAASRHIAHRGDTRHRHHQDEDRCKQARHRLVPPRPPPRPLQRGRPPRLDRSPLKEPPQVVAEVRRRAVPPCRLLAEALQADRLQVAHGSPGRSERGATGSDSRTRCKVSASVSPRNGVRPTRI